MTPYPELPDRLNDKLARARRLEWWTLFFFATILAAMWFALGASQAMRTALIEDALSVIPPVLFLISTRFERRQPTRAYPFGFHRAGSLAFFLAACALALMGCLLLIEAIKTLINSDYPTIGTVRLWGHEVWMGWPMIAALVWSIIPPVILGRMKRDLGQPLADKVLQTDADMNAADWHTGAAAIAGIFGIWLGYWWTDAAAAAIISISILRDGLRNGRVALGELMDGLPRELDEPDKIDPTAERIRDRLEELYPDASIRIRLTGRYMRAVIAHSEPPSDQLARDLAGEEDWRLIEVSRQIDEHEARAAEEEAGR